MARFRLSCGSPSAQTPAYILAYSDGRGVVAATVIGYGRFGGPLGGGDFIARVEVKGVILHDDDRIKSVSLPRTIASKRLSFALTVPVGRSSAARPSQCVARARRRKTLGSSYGRHRDVRRLYDCDCYRSSVCARRHTDRVDRCHSTDDEITKLLEMVGVSARSFKSGALKATVAAEPLTPRLPQRRSHW